MSPAHTPLQAEAVLSSLIGFSINRTKEANKSFYRKIRSVKSEINYADQIYISTESDWKLLIKKRSKMKKKLNSHVFCVEAIKGSEQRSTKTTKSPAIAKQMK